MHARMLCAALLVIPLGCDGTDISKFALSRAWTPGSASGSLTVGDRTMQIRGAVGTWNRSDKTVVIALLPFPPTQQEAHAMVGESFLFLDDAKNPDPTIFSACPYGFVKFRFHKVSGVPNLVAADAVSFAFHGFLSTSGSSMIELTRSHLLAELAHCELSVQGDSAGKAVVAFEGGSDGFPQPHSWTIDVRAPVFVK